MLKSSIHESDDLKPFASVFKDIISVESTQIFKPAPGVYHHLVKAVGKNWESKEEVGKVWLVSGNPFDVVGARNIGMKTCWVDRSGNGWTDRLMGEDEEFKPDLIVTGVKDAVEGVAGWDEWSLSRGTRLQLMPNVPLLYWIFDRVSSDVLCSIVLSLGSSKLTKAPNIRLCSTCTALFPDIFQQHRCAFAHGEGATTARTHLLLV